MGEADGDTSDFADQALNLIEAVLALVMARIHLKPALAATVMLFMALSSVTASTTYLTLGDLDRMKALFESTLNNAKASMDTTALHYATLGYKSAGADPSKFSSSVCDVLKKRF